MCSFILCVDSCRSHRSKVTFHSMQLENLQKTSANCVDVRTPQLATSQLKCKRTTTYQKPTPNCNATIHCARIARRQQHCRCRRDSLVLAAAPQTASPRLHGNFKHPLLVCFNGLAKRKQPLHYLRSGASFNMIRFSRSVVRCRPFCCV